MAFCGAYAIRPYRVTRKMIAVGAYHWVRYEKRGAMPAFYRLTWRRSYACNLYYLGALGLTPDCKDQIFGTVSLRNIQDEAIIQPNLLPDDYARLAEKIGFENISMTISPIQKSRCDRVFWGNIQKDPYRIIRRSTSFGCDNVSSSRASFKSTRQLLSTSYIIEFDF